MRIHSPLMTNSNATGSFTGSFTGSYSGDGSGLTGLESSSFATTASYVEYSNVANKPTLISGSAQIAADISGSFTAPSSSLSLRVTNLEVTASSLTTDSGSFSTRVTNTEASASSLTINSGSFSTRVTSLEAFSSSLDATYATDAQVGSATSSLSASLAVDIANLVSDSGSFSTRITSLEAFSSSLDTTYATDAELNAATSSLSSSIASTYLLNTTDTFTGNLTVTNTVDASSVRIADALVHDTDTHTRLEFASDQIKLNTSGSTRINITNSGVDIFDGLDMNSTKITQVQDPTLAQDAATKNYVDTSIETSVSSLNSSTGSYLLNTSDTLTGNLEVTGNVTGSNLLNSNKITTSKLNVYNRADFDDNVKAYFGDQSDLSIYHDGSNSYIAEGGVGALNLLSNLINFKSLTTDTTMATFDEDGAVSLSYSGSTKLQTTANGVTITGTLIADGTTLSAANISGSFTATSASFSSDITTLSSSLASRVTSNDADILVLQNFSSSVDTALSFDSNNVTVAGDLTVSGTASINYLQSVTGEAKIIGDNYIILNADTPSQRYSGIKVYDSGSAGETGSLEYDSISNHWFYESTNEGYASILMAGPKGTRGSLTTPTSGSLVVAAGNHLNTSNITDLNGKVSIDANTVVTGSLTTSGNVGVGTTSTTGTYGKLTVNGGIRLLDDQNGKLEIGRYSSGASNSYIKLGANSNSLRITNSTDTVDIFTLTNSGNATFTGTVSGTGFASTTSVNGTGDSGLGIVSGGRLGFDQSGTRSWTVKAAGGNLAFASGDGNGSLTFNSNRLLTVADEGTGNGLDADTVDTLQASQFLRSDAADTATGTITISGLGNSLIADHDVSGTNWSGRIISKNDTTGVASFLGNYNGFPGVFAHNSALDAWNSIFINTLSTSGNGNANVYTGTLYVNGNTAWHAGNDGAGSGLDADTLDTLQASQFLRSDTSDTFSGVLSMNRTTGQPSIKGGNDHIVIDSYDATTNVYLQNYHAGDVALATGGGKVGVGTASPKAQLHVQSGGSYNNTDNNNRLFIEYSAGSPYILFSSPDERDQGIHFHNTTDNTFVGRIAYQHRSAGDKMFFRVGTTSGNGQVVINSSGRVGIGTDSPSNKLHVVSGDNEGIYMQGTGGGHWFNFKSGTSNLWSMGAQSGLMGWYNRTDSTYKMVITDGGNVGIGTSSPSRKLDVVGGYFRTSDATSGTQAAFVQGGTSYAYFGNLGNGPAAFGNSENYTTLVADGGNVGIGTTSPTAALHVYQSGSTVFQVEGSLGQLFSVDDDLTGEIFAVSDISGIPIMSIDSGGVVTIDDTLYVTGDITAYYSSDERLKKNIKPIEEPLEKLKQISGNTFEWDEENPVHRNTGKDVGVIAQEIEKVLPELVTERKGGYKAVQYDKIVALLIESNKELATQNESLLARIEVLESKIN